MGPPIWIFSFLHILDLNLKFFSDCFLISHIHRYQLEESKIGPVWSLRPPPPPHRAPQIGKNIHFLTIVWPIWPYMKKRVLFVFLYAHYVSTVVRSAFGAPSTLGFYVIPNIFHSKHDHHKLTVSSNLDISGFLMFLSIFHCIQYGPVVSMAIVTTQDMYPRWYQHIKVSKIHYQSMGHHTHHL